MEKDMKKAFSALKSSLRRLKTLAAWRDLEQSEFRPTSPLHPRQDSTLSDMRVEVGRFWETVLAVREPLAGLPSQHRDAAQQQLSRLIEDLRKFEKLARP